VDPTPRLAMSRARPIPPQAPGAGGASSKPGQRVRSAALEWAFFWRFLVIIVPAEFIAERLALVLALPSLAYNLIAFATALACIVIAAYWLSTSASCSVSELLAAWSQHRRARHDLAHLAKGPAADQSRDRKPV
ncbi:MAG: hypothetical protein ACREXY_15000, partial [Gammaproteobacteria bacterium]